MTDEIQKQPQQEIQKPGSSDSKITRETLKKYFKSPCDPSEVLKEFDSLMSQHNEATGKQKKEIEEKISQKGYEALMLLGLDNHYLLAETVDARYRPSIIEAANNLVKEYDCKTPGEKMLAQVAAVSHARILANARWFNNCITFSNSLTDIKTRYLAAISKELDRANRQFISALSTLKQLKTPNFEVNVKAKTAFIAQNQQINATQKDGDNQQYENIKP